MMNDWWQLTGHPIPRKCWENNWSHAGCTHPATVQMEDATGSGAGKIWLCEGHARDYEDSGAPWKRFVPEVKPKVNA
jgi:hypothetical protein